MLLSGGSRGIGLAIAVKAALAGANVALIAKTRVEDPRLPGTLYTAAEEIERSGGAVLPIVGDVRDSGVVDSAVRQTVESFGSIDILVNNASAIDLQGVGVLPPRRFRLLLDVNVHGTYHMIASALPHLLRSPRPQVMTLSPPLNPDPRWLSSHAPYTLTKYGMTMLTLGLAQQYMDSDLSAYCLWPETLIATAAVANVVAGQEGMKNARMPAIVADAAGMLFAADRATTNGRCFVDADVLRESGRLDLSEYAAAAGTSEDALARDLFL